MVRYFVREEAGEFVYLALQLCQLSLHNAMAQIHLAMVRFFVCLTKPRSCPYRGGKVDDSVSVSMLLPPGPCGGRSRRRSCYCCT